MACGRAPPTVRGVVYTEIYRGALTVSGREDPGRGGDCSRPRLLIMLVGKYRGLLDDRPAPLPPEPVDERRSAGPRCRLPLPGDEAGSPGQRRAPTRYAARGSTGLSLRDRPRALPPDLAGLRRGRRT